MMNKPEILRPPKTIIVQNENKFHSDYHTEKHNLVIVHNRYVWQEFQKNNDNKSDRLLYITDIQLDFIFPVRLIGCQQACSAILS